MECSSKIMIATLSWTPHAFAFHFPRLVNEPAASSIICSFICLLLSPITVEQGTILIRGQDTIPAKLRGPRECTRWMKRCQFHKCLACLICVIFIFNDIPRCRAAPAFLPRITRMPFSQTVEGINGSCKRRKQAFALRRTLPHTTRHNTAGARWTSGAAINHSDCGSSASAFLHLPRALPSRSAYRYLLYPPRSCAAHGKIWRESAERGPRIEKPVSETPILDVAELAEG